MSAQIARRGGLLIEYVCKSKVLQTLEKLAIRFSQLKPVLRYNSDRQYICKRHTPFLLPPPDTLTVNVDATFPPQSAHDAGDVPPPIPPKHFLNDDVLLLWTLPENRELEGNGRNPPLTCFPKANQKDTTIPLLPPNMNQQTTVSDQMCYPTIYSKKSLIRIFEELKCSDNCIMTEGIHYNATPCDRNSTWSELQC